MADTPVQSREVLTSPLGIEPLEWKDLWPLTNFGDVHVDGRHLRSWSSHEHREGVSSRTDRLVEIDRAVSSFDNSLIGAFEEEILADVANLATTTFAQDVDIRGKAGVLEDAIRDKYHKEAAVAVDGLNALLAKESSVVWVHLYQGRSAEQSIDSTNSGLAIVRGFYVEQQGEFGLQSAMILEGRSEKVGLAPAIGHQAVGIYTESHGIIEP